MSQNTNRISPAAGWRDSSKLPRGPNGRALCRRCGTEVPAGRRAWCGDACVHDHQIESDPGYARVQVDKRDNGVCALCGLDTEAWRKAHEAERARQGRAKVRWDQRYPHHYVNYAVERTPDERWRDHFELRIAGAFRRLASRLDAKLERVMGRGHRWEMDHTIPVVEGGGSCGLDNLRTLCIRCHRGVTKQLAGRRARARRPQQELPLVGR